MRYERGIDTYVVPNELASPAPPATSGTDTAATTAAIASGIGTAAVASTAAVPVDPLVARFRRAVRADVALYERILTFAPVSLSELCASLAAHGVHVARADVARFVASESVHLV